MLRRLLSLFILAALLPFSAVYSIEDDDRILVWSADVAAPGQQSGNDPGQLAWLDSTGFLNTLLPVPQAANRVEFCGSPSPDGQTRVLFMGNDESPQGGAVYLLQGDALPVQFDSIGFLGCAGGNGRLHFSPDGGQFGYIAYESDARFSTFADGTFKLADVAAPDAPLVEAPSAVAFHVAAEGTAYMTFGTDSRGVANEVILYWWDGASEREIFNITLPQGCGYESAYVRAYGDHFWMVLGEDCGGGANWQLYRVQRDSSNAFLALNIDPSGGLSSIAEVNNLWFAPDDNTLIYTLPDGSANNSVSVNRVPLNDFFAGESIIGQHARVPSFSSGTTAPPILSSDGTLWALVTASPQGESALQILNLADLDAPPVSFLPEARDEGILWMAFTPDDAAIIALVSSPTQGAENALYRIDPATGTGERIVRGAFYNAAALAPSGDEVAILEWADPLDADNRPQAQPHLDFVVIDVEDGERTVILAGEEAIEEGYAQRFAVPLWWR